jgi:hypothetical protein
MPEPRIAATWIFADDGTDGKTIRAWAGDVVGAGGGRAFEQVTVGRGALLFGPEAEPVAPPDWVARSASGSFVLRSIDPRGSDPALDGSPFLLAVRLHVPERLRDEMRRWLDEEHSRLQLTVDGTQWFAGYEEVGERHSFLNLWGLRDPEVAESEAWKQARDTPWLERLLAAVAGQERAVYRPIRPPADTPTR